MGKKILKFLFFGSLSILFVFMIMVGLIWLIFPSEKNHLEDEVLIEKFEKNRESFDKLVVMFHEDKNMSVIDDTWMRPKNGISQKRWAEYKKLVQKLELDFGIRRCNGEDCIEFISTSQGLPSAGTAKGYVYKPQNTESIDRHTANGIMYKKINKDWYIFFEWDS